jgi:hypothetical protein
MVVVCFYLLLLLLLLLLHEYLEELKRNTQERYELDGYFITSSICAK